MKIFYLYIQGINQTKQGWYPHTKLRRREVHPQDMISSSSVYDPHQFPPFLLAVAQRRALSRSTLCYIARHEFCPQHYYNSERQSSEGGACSPLRIYV